MQVRSWILCFVGVALTAFSCPARAQQETHNSLNFEETLNKQYDLKKQQISRLFQDKVQKISERTSLPEEMRQALIRQADEVRAFDLGILQQKLEMKIKHAKERDVIKDRLKNDAMNRVKWIMENERDFQENKKTKEQETKLPAAPSPVASSEAAPSAAEEAMKTNEAVAAPSPVASSEAVPSAAEEAVKKDEAAAVLPAPALPSEALAPVPAMPTPADAGEAPMPADVDEAETPLPPAKASAVSGPAGKEMSSGGLIRETVPAPRVLQ